jgi:diacylglycerol O-acyltransferase / wax synthase
MGPPAGAGARAERVVRPLSAEDLSILELENETVAGHTCKVVVLGGPLDPERLRASIAARVSRAPELSMRLAYADGRPCWAPAPDLDLAAHVVFDASPEPLDEAALRATVARLFEQRLDRSRPLWRIDVLPRLAGGQSALVWRIHHALADGSTAMRMMAAVLWDADGGPRSGATRPKAAGAAERAGSAVSHAKLGHLPTVAREVPHPWHHSPFDGHISARRSVAFSTVELAGLREVATTVDRATVNDAVLTVVAGGLRRWIESHHGHLGTVRVKVPVSLHGAPDDDASAGNRDSFFCLDLPLGAADPIERLAAIRDATRTRKQAHDAQQIDALMRELGRASPRLRRLAEQALAGPRSFAVNVSNVPGPHEPVRVLGVPVRALYSLAEIRERHALRVAVASLGDSLNFGLCADPTLLEDVDELAADMHAEGAALLAHRVAH